MRQVPSYLLIGNGRVSRHFQHYFKQLALPFHVWQRSDGSEALVAQVSLATHILLLINDGAIEDFITEILNPLIALARTANDVVLAKAGVQSFPFLIHCSGSLVTDLAHGAHPLMTFAHDFYDLAHYHGIPFVLDDDAPAFSDLLPGLPNTHTRINKKLKAKYHALCVLSGNFSCLLWNKLFDDFEQELNLPSNMAHPYLQQQMRNLLDNPKRALTGPLTRNDQRTIANHLEALSGDPFQEVYRSFVSCYHNINNDTKTGSKGA